MSTICEVCNDPVDSDCRRADCPYPKKQRDLYQEVTDEIKRRFGLNLSRQEVKGLLLGFFYGMHEQNDFKTLDEAKEGAIKFISRGLIYFDESSGYPPDKK
jgi:hypothetical protein